MDQSRAGCSADGNVAVLFALMLPVVLLLAGAGVDMQRWRLQNAQLRDFADALALRGARELLIANAQPSQIKMLLESAGSGSFAIQMTGHEVKVAASVDKENGEVTINATQPALDALIMSRLSPQKQDFTATAIATARGGAKICVIALEGRAEAAVRAEDQATLDAAPCSIMSNSTSSRGVIARKKSKLTAAIICSAGGAEGGEANFSTPPTKDCPEYPDPLAARPAPSVGPCTHQNFRLGYLGAVTSALPLIRAKVSPGVYCGGLRIEKMAEVEFEPGVYVIKDGPLLVGAKSTLKGAHVGFHLVGDAATFEFERDSEITLSAPKDGPLAGILFFEDRDAPLGRTHRVLSRKARELLGTFYLSRGVLEVDTDAPVADTSAYTALVVRRLELKGKPKLVLNADYARTDVPVPIGVGPIGGEVFLRD